MERLTHPRSSGIKTGYWSPNKKGELIERLAAYEDTGLAPQEIYGLKAEPVLKAVEPQWIPACNPPQPGVMVWATIKHSAWVSDYNSDWVPNEEKIEHPEELEVCKAYHLGGNLWQFYNEYGVVCCDSVERAEAERDPRCVYDTVTAWMPFPEPYKG